MQPYEKILGKIDGKLDLIRTEINSLPDINIFNLPIRFVENVLKPDSSSRLKELRERLGQLKAQAKSTLDIYSRSDQEKGKTAYLSRITATLAEIDILEERLSKKDLYLLISDDGNNSRPTSKTKYESGTDWKDLDLNI